MSLLSLHKIYKSYEMAGEQLTVLNGLSLDIEKGELLAVVGQSGSGKSTLMHIMGGLDKPTSGEVIFEGKNIYSLDSVGLDRYRNKHIGFVFQFHYLLDDFNAVENVALPAVISGQSLNDAKKHAAELLDMVGLKDRMTHHPKELSGGEQQRVSVARALMNNPTIVLADEPTGNLDRANSEVVQNLLFGLKKLDIAVVIVTHDQSIAEHCDKTLQMVKA